MEGPTREPDEARRYEVNRTTLRAWCWGDAGAPPVLLAHGAFDHGRMFDDFAPRIADLGFRAVAIDVRGHGDSGRIASGHTWTPATLDLCELARVLADEAGTPGAPIGVIGHSMGGGMACTAAGTAPERFAWAVNMDGLGPPAANFSMPDPVEAATMAIDALERNAGRSAKVWPDRASMAARRGQTNIRLSPAWLDHLAYHGSQEIEGGFIWKFDPVFAYGLPDGFDLESILAGYGDVECPVLALCSTEQDGWTEVDVAEAQRRVECFPDARLVPIADSGHYVHIEQPDAVLAAIVEFLDEIGALPDRRTAS